MGKETAKIRFLEKWSPDYTKGQIAEVSVPFAIELIKGGHAELIVSKPKLKPKPKPKEKE